MRYENVTTTSPTADRLSSGLVSGDRNDGRPTVDDDAPRSPPRTTAGGPRPPAGLLRFEDHQCRNHRSHTARRRPLVSRHRVVVVVRRATAVRTSRVFHRRRVSRAPSTPLLPSGVPRSTYSHAAGPERRRRDGTVVRLARPDPVISAGPSFLSCRLCITLSSLCFRRDFQVAPCSVGLEPRVGHYPPVTSPRSV